MTIIALFSDAGKRPMRVAAFMSGSGSNVRKLIEYQRNNPAAGYEVAVLFTDKPTKSKTAVIAQESAIPWVGLPFIEYFNKHGLDRKDHTNLPVYYTAVAEQLRPYDIDAIALGGFMRLVPQSFLDIYPVTVNVHPADLAIRDANGKRLLVGEDALGDAMKYRFMYARATTFIVDAGEDTGPILLRSDPAYRIDYGLDVAANQERLKVVGDHVIFAPTLREIARGAFGRNLEGMIYHNQTAVPQGVLRGRHE